MTTLEDIKNYMINSLSYEPKEAESDYEHPYDKDRHCSDSLYEEIKGFWYNFNTNQNFEYVVSGRFLSDGFDLNGGRSYLLNDDKLIDMFFDYMHNTLDLTDDLEYRYNELENNNMPEPIKVKEPIIISTIRN